MLIPLWHIQRLMRKKKKKERKKEMLKTYTYFSFFKWRYTLAELSFENSPGIVCFGENYL